MNTDADPLPDEYLDALTCPVCHPFCGCGQCGECAGAPTPRCWKHNPPTPSPDVSKALADVATMAPCISCGGVDQGNTCCPPDCAP